MHLNEERPLLPFLLLPPYFTIRCQNILSHRDDVTTMDVLKAHWVTICCTLNVDYYELPWASTKHKKNLGGV